MKSGRSSEDPVGALLEPRSIAVFGVSADEPGKTGNVILRNLINCGYRGSVYGIGRAAGTVEGVPCFTDIGQVPDPIDTVFLTVPAAATQKALNECARAGARSAIVGSSGYAESGTAEGAALQEFITSVARAADIRVMGPNCNGLYNTHHSLSLGFNTAHSKKLRKGEIAVISHSGALFDAMMQSLPDFAGLSVFVSSGNEADLTTLDYLEYVIEQPHTRVVALLVDAITDGPRLRRLSVRASELNKPIVALKLGRSASGASLATAHSSRIAGDEIAYAALFEACGIFTVSSVEALMAAAAVLSWAGRISGGLAVMCTSGAGASLIADLAETHGIQLPAFTDAMRESLAAHRRSLQLHNPLDIGVLKSIASQGVAFETLGSDPRVGAMMAFMHSFSLPIARIRIDELARVAAACKKPMLVVVPGGLPAEEHALYKERGLPVLMDTDCAMQAIAAMLFRKPQGVSFAAKAKASPAVTSGQWVGEFESLAMLQRFGIPAVRTIMCRSLAEAVEAAGKIGWPVVLKAATPGVAHKSDQGLVHLNIRNAGEMEAAYLKLNAGATIVQQMISGELELILGIHKSLDVGLTMIAGLGGIHAEALDSVTAWNLPVDRAAIETKLTQSKVGRLLLSSRWKYPDSLARLVDVLESLQEFALSAASDLQAVDINPLILGRSGLTAVDALVVAKS